MLTISDHDDPFASLTPEQLSKELALSTVSFYAVAKLFAALPPSEHNRVFIYTGNGSTKLSVPALVSLGVAKNSAAYIIEAAANSYGKSGEGKQSFWYYADERTKDGGHTTQISGEAHAEFFSELAS